MTDLRYDTVTLLTDLGLAGGQVGVLHSIVRQMAPGAGIVDLTHDVEPFDVRGASLVLARSVQYLCPGVIVGAVDPAAGSTQRRLALEVAGGAAVLLGPDNGVLAPAVGMIGGAERAVVLDDPEFWLPTAATTFAARDVYAPVAAHLCNGVALTDLGTEIDPAALMPGLVPLTSVEDDADGRPVLTAEVLMVDRFGNIQLNVDPAELEGWGTHLEVSTGGPARTATWVTAFSEIATGSIGLLVDSDGLVSVVADRHPASTDLSVTVGDSITLTRLDDDARPGVRTSVSIGRNRPSDPTAGVS